MQRIAKIKKCGNCKELPCLTGLKQIKMVNTTHIVADNNIPSVLTQFG